MATRWRYFIQHLFLAVYSVSIPAAATGTDTRAPSAQQSGASTDMSDFLSLELVVLVGFKSKASIDPITLTTAQTKKLGW